MNRWGNSIAGMLALVTVEWLYLDGSPPELMTSVLLLLALFYLVREHTGLAIVYLVLAVNLLFLLLAFWLGEGRVSYLGNEGFEPYYKKALVLETLFWAATGWMVELRSGAKTPVSGDAGVNVRVPVKGLMSVAAAMLVLELALSHRHYFSGYTEVSDTGTVLYELGCLLLAIGVVARRRRPAGACLLLLEAAGVGVALFIAMGSGKRLPLSYLVLAYMLLVLRRRGKACAALLFPAISMLGYLFGIVRDAMVFGGIDLARLVAGFQSTNQGAVLHASAVYLRIADEGLSSLLDRGIAFLSNCFGTLLLPLSMLPESAQVNVFAMQFYPVQGNGGFIGSYAYYFLGWSGPLLGAIALGWLLSRAGRWSERGALMIILTSPRWLLYNMGPVVRLMSMTLVILAGIEILVSWSMHRSVRRQDPARRP